MSPIAESILDRLDATRQRWWLFTLFATAVLGICVSLAVLLVFLLADVLWKLPQPALATMLLLWLAMNVVLIGGLCRRLVHGQRTLEATARRVEAELPELGSHLINVVQFAADWQPAGAAFREAALRQAADEIRRFRFDRAAGRAGRWKRLRLCMQTPRDLFEFSLLLAVVLGLALVCQMLIPTLGSAARRLLAPWTFVPQIGSVEIVEVTPGDVDVPIGGGLEIAATIHNPEGKPYAATAWIAQSDSDEVDYPMSADDTRTHYRLAVPTVTEPLAYRLEIGDSQTRIYHVGVRRKPAIAEVEIVYHFPGYLGRRPKTVRQRHADLEAPQYTVAELRIRPSAPVAKGHACSQGMSFPGRVSDQGNRLTIAKLPMVKSGTFTVHLENDAGHHDPEPRPNRMHVVPDRTPNVTLMKPPRHSSAAPGEKVALVLRAADDHGVGRARLEVRALDAGADSAGASAPAPGEINRLKEWTDLAGHEEVMLRHELLLDPARYVPGQTVLVRAVAWDRRNIDQNQWGLELRPQRAQSAWHTIRILHGDRKIEAQLQQLDSLRAAIYRILLEQIRGRIDTARVPKLKQPEQASALARAVRRRQVDIQASTTRLVQSIEHADRPPEQTIKRVLNTLATGKMLEAVRRAEALIRHCGGQTQGTTAGLSSSADQPLAAAPARRTGATGVPPVLVATEKGIEKGDSPIFAAQKSGQSPLAGPAAELGQTQQSIIETLRGLLDVVRRAQSELLAEMQNRPGGDLPNETRSRLTAAKKKLEEFLRQQKKVIEATKNLAKKPVDDFTDEEKELMRQLAATEDDWARFLEELHSDLSKLAEQDFANSSMLNELNEIQTQIKMAEDALVKKAADIAVPLEQLGAEMAEELLTNMEKWLPDEPDRERWSQEESLTDLDKEAPMAELPGELEDLVGELFEEEEDLFDELEDVSSSAADSLDKGAGWDAKDGPISNMSAKGVTGNTLPNTSEMSGRSGEGRSGKSSGEFVGDEAVGKGGRKTPSRLTPDPYEKGQVKDHSRDSVGGATGGGKESGQGGQGLEGPRHRFGGQRDLKRLAGKQASLRNKAEAIDLKFEIMNYHRTDLKKMIEVMAQVERDLKAGRYQNALRRRNVLAEGLGNVKQYLEGQVELRRDTTVNLPAGVQKDILGGMQDPSPAGWEALNRQYYERLSKGNAKK